MDNNHWSIERWRFALVLFLAILGGVLSGYWLISLTFSLAGYIAWLLYKLHQLHRWIENGASTKFLPDSNGIWERLVHQVQLMKKKSNTRKRRMSKLLKRMQGIIMGMPYATIVLNGENEIDWANKMSLDYLNIDSKKDRGQRLDNLIRLPVIGQMLAKKESHVIEVSLPHNTQRQLAIQVIPVQKDLKLLIARDVSERVNTLKMRKNFIANASHELRTPLTVISGYLEMLRSDERLPDDLQLSVLSASEQSARMQSIIEDLLTLSRLENSELNDESNTIITIPHMLKTIINNERSLITESGHLIETDIDEDLKITGSEAEIMSVCSNLIHNSVRHTQAGTTVKVHWQKDEYGNACLSIIDNGQGIATEHISHLTERFYRVDKGRSRDKGGTGLGLAIVQHIIQRHGSKLDIQSTLGKGSTFTVCFPKERVVI